MIRRFAHVLCGALAAALLGLALAGAAPRSDSRAPAGEGRALVVRLEGAVSPVMDEVLEHALARAAREHYRVLVLEVDTPGGLESSMREMIKRLLASQTPVIGWVTPSGAHAASAGVFIVMACDIAAMSPGTNIGAATPISMHGPLDSTLARKVTNDAAAFARTVAAQRHRNVRWAEAAVRQAVAISETEAVRDSVVDFVAGDLADLLARADGRAWHLSAALGPLATRGLPSDRVEPDFRQRLLARLADPNIAYLLMMLGFYGLFFELQNPGAILPGVVGGICLVLALFSLSALPVNTAGIALLLGVAFLLAEIKVQSHGMLAVGGTIALVLGGLMLFQAGTVRVAWPVLAGTTLATVIFFSVVIGAGVRAGRAPVETGAAAMRRRLGVALDRLAPEGRVRVDGETWNARASEVIEVGERIEVQEMQGLKLAVRKAPREV